MIKIDCPGCEKGLEIDAGFAGGICRCYDCGTLMTVPESGGAAERLERTGRPDAPGARPDSPGGVREEAPAPEADTFVTSTGKKVTVTKEQLQHVVVAKKARMGVRAAVIGGFVFFVLVMIVLLVILSANMLRQADLDRAARGGDGETSIGPNVVGTDVVQDLYTYDPNANPYFIEEPNLFGMPVEEGQTIVVVSDTSSAMRQHIDFVKEVLPINAKAIGEAAKLQVGFAAEAGEKVYPQQPQPASQWDLLAFKGMAEEIQADGAIQLADAVEQAIGRSPTRLVLIFSLTPVSFEMDRIAALLEGKSIKVDVIQLGRFDLDVQTFAEEHDGRYIELPDGQIERWYVEYLNKK